MDMEADEHEEAGADTPSVMAHFSAVSLTEVSSTPHLQHDLQRKQNKSALSPSSVDVSGLDPLSEMACTGVSHSAEVDLLQAEKQGVDGPCWAEMLPDALAKIFSRLSLKELLCTIPCVCRYWQCVSQDAPCWQDINLSDWSYEKPSKVVDKMLLLLANRSQGGLRTVCVPNLKSDGMLQVLVCSGPQLQVLRILDSFVSEECLCELAPKLSFLNYLDISGRFPSRALIESFGKHCQLITRLNMNMRLNVSESKTCDVAALAVAQYMPQLRHLEMAYGLLSNVGLKALLENCKSLEHLDLRGCWHVDVEESLVLETRKRLQVFLLPVVEDDIYNITDSDADFEDEDDPYFSDYMLEDAEYYDDIMCDNLGAFEDMSDHHFEEFDGHEVFMDEEETASSDSTSSSNSDSPVL